MVATHSLLLGSAALIAVTSALPQPQLAADALLPSSSNLTLPNVTYVATQGIAQCLDAQNATVINGTSIVTNACSNTTATQAWSFVAGKQNNTQVLQSANDMCMDVTNGLAANGTAVQLWQCNLSNSNQFWAKDGDLLRWNSSQYCLDVQNGTEAAFPNNSTMQIWACNANNTNQNFTAPANVVTPLPVTVLTSPTSDDSDDDSSDDSGLLDGLLGGSDSSSSSSSGTVNNGTSTGPFNSARKRMLAWGYSNDAAPVMAAGSKVGTYYHWQMNRIPNMPSDVPFLPMYWGISKKSDWEQVKATLGKTVPPAVLGFNEPDLSSYESAGMDPISSAQEYYNEISQVYGTKGSMMVSPAIAWNVDGWLAPFMKQCAKLGCGIDAVAYHIYLSLSKDGNGDVDNLISIIEKRVTYLYNKFNKPVVLSELGLTQAGGGSSAQLQEFFQKAAAFLDNSPMVIGWALSAAFEQGSGWDSFINGDLAFFTSSGGLSSVGRQYMNTAF
jgi:hypothetical protein